MGTGRHQRGVTLVELVIVIGLLGIIAALLSVVFHGPVEGYVATTARAALVDSAQTAIDQMASDIRSALPNSVRVDAAGTALELLHVQDGSRYRAGPANIAGGGNPDLRLQFNKPDDQFNVVAPLADIDDSSHYLVVYNVGVSGADAYAVGAQHNVITPTGTHITIAPDTTLTGETHVTLNPPFQFAWPSPNRRIFLVDHAVSYLCDSGGGTLSRYVGYPFGTVQPTVTSPPPVTPQLQARHVRSCSFSYASGAAAGTSSRAGLVTLRLTLSDSAAGTITLVEQVHVDNAS